VITASPARALTASLLDYVVEEVSTAAYRTRASRSTTDFRLNRPVDWSGWGMPALEVIRYKLFLMATCYIDGLSANFGFSLKFRNIFSCVLATNPNCFLNRVIHMIGYTTRWGGGGGIM
jgi:hypothetical protein